MLFKLLYIIIFHGILNVVQEFIVHVIAVFHVHIKVHVQLIFVRQLRQVIQVSHNMVTVDVQEPVFTVVHVILLVAVIVAVYVHEFK